MSTSEGPKTSPDYIVHHLTNLTSGEGLSAKAVADHHYAFMGAAPIRALKAKANELAGLLKKDKVDAVLLSPV